MACHYACKSMLTQGEAKFDSIAVQHVAAGVKEFAEY